MFTVMIEFGRCGFGASGGLVPELRCGVVRLAYTRGSVVGRMHTLLASLGDAAAELRRLAERQR